MIVNSLLVFNYALHLGDMWGSGGIASWILDMIARWK